MIRHHPRSTLPATLFPSTTLFRSTTAAVNAAPPLSQWRGSIAFCLKLSDRFRYVSAIESNMTVAPYPLPRPPMLIRIHPPKEMGEPRDHRSEEHTSELQSLMRLSYAVFCLKKKNNK